jgi:hypothetical protein
MTASNAASRNIIELNLGVSVCTLRVSGYAHILASSEFGLDIGLPRGGIAPSLQRWGVHQGAPDADRKEEKELMPDMSKGR